MLRATSKLKHSNEMVGHVRGREITLSGLVGYERSI